MAAAVGLVFVDTWLRLVAHYHRLDSVCIRHLVCQVSANISSVSCLKNENLKPSAILSN